MRSVLYAVLSLASIYTVYTCAVSIALCMRDLEIHVHWMGNLFEVPYCFITIAMTRHTCHDNNQMQRESGCYKLIKLVMLVSTDTRAIHIRLNAQRKRLTIMELYRSGVPSTSTRIRIMNYLQF